MFVAWIDSVATFVRTRTTPVLVALAAMVVGIGLSTGYASVTAATSSQQFCAHACHEMERTVTAEYAQSRHHINPKGTVVTCAECHLPGHAPLRLMGHQITALSRVWGHFIDREDLPGRFEARRPELAKKVLADFAATNARECKACHSYAILVATEQAVEAAQARRDHTSAMKTDGNCLSCHQGVTHTRQDQPASYDFP
jgi:nitrate/TMAO reductase-like tetraheme cytochrome c subunit